MEQVELPIDIDQVKGFLHPDEGAALYRQALIASRLGPCLEIGSYCGKSTLYLAAACRQTDALLYAIDHHGGSEEHQLGEEYHDPELYDREEAVMDSFRTFRRNLRRAGLDAQVVPIVAPSALAARHWNTPLGMVFIDGGHSLEAALTDYRCWAGHLVPGGILAIHDIFPDPRDGGQAPHQIYQLASAAGLFEQLPMARTLGLLRRL